MHENVRRLPIAQIMNLMYCVINIAAFTTLIIIYYDVEENIYKNLPLHPKSSRGAPRRDRVTRGVAQEILAEHLR